MEKRKALELIHGKMAASIKELGSMIKLMEKVNFTMLMEQYTKDK